MIMKLKRIIFALYSFAGFLSCKAQTILPLKNHNDLVEGVYYKDLDNFLDQFVGTWKYQNGQEEFLIKLKKETMYAFSDHFEDQLYGEYSYTNPNGVNLINTLSQIDQTMDLAYHNISTSLVIGKQQLISCPDCSNDEYRIRLLFNDPLQKHVKFRLILRYVNPTTIKARIQYTGHILLHGTEPMPIVTIPRNIDYIMTKQ